MSYGLIETNAGVAGPGGVAINTSFAHLANRTGGALAAGDLVMFDMAASATETTNTKVGDAASVFANVVAVTTAGSKAYPLAVAAEAIADNATGKFILRGIVETKVQKGSGAVAVGDPLCAENASDEFLADLVDGAKIVGICQSAIADDDTSAGAGGTATVLFNGIEGFGVHVAA